MALIGDSATITTHNSVNFVIAEKQFSGIGWVKNFMDQPTVSLNQEGYINYRQLNHAQAPRVSISVSVIFNETQRKSLVDEFDNFQLKLKSNLDPDPWAVSDNRIKWINQETLNMEFQDYSMYPVNLTYTEVGETLFKVDLRLEQYNPSFSIPSTTLPEGLIAYWDAESLTDKVNSFILTSTNASANTITGSGKIGSSYLFDSNNSLINSDFSTFLDDTTISLWASFDFNDFTPDIILSRISNDGAGQSFQLMRSGTNRIYFSTTNSNDISSRKAVSSKFIFITGTYYHFLITYNKITTVAKIYINGSEILSLKQANISQPAIPLTVGGTNEEFAMRGNVDELGVWKKILTTQEIGFLYNNGAGLPYEDF